MKSDSNSEKPKAKSAESAVSSPHRFSLPNFRKSSEQATQGRSPFRLLKGSRNSSTEALPQLNTSPDNLNIIGEFAEKYPENLKILLGKTDDENKAIRVQLPRLLAATGCLENVLARLCVEEQKNLTREGPYRDAAPASRMIVDLFNTSVAVRDFCETLINKCYAKLYGETVDVQSIRLDVALKNKKMGDSEKLQMDEKLARLIGIFVCEVELMRKQNLIPAEMIVAMHAVRSVHDEPTVEIPKYIKELGLVFFLRGVNPRLSQEAGEQVFVLLSKVFLRMTGELNKPEDNAEFAAIYPVMQGFTEPLAKLLDAIASQKISWRPKEPLIKEAESFCAYARKLFPECEMLKASEHSNATVKARK